MISILTKQKYSKKRKSRGILEKLSSNRLALKAGAYIRTTIPPNSSGGILVNFGVHSFEGGNYSQILNKPEAIKQASNKLRFFKALKEHSITMDYYTSLEEAKEAMQDGSWVMCRTLLSSSSGRGCVLAKTPEELVEARLYTQYYRKTHEYRYHVFQGKIIDIQQKKRLTQEQLEVRGFTERPPSYIRNLANGYIFAREGVEEIPEMSEMSIKTIELLGLDFGAVDVLVFKKDGVFKRGCVCEVNTAPGLSGTTLEKYSEALKDLL